MVHCTRTVPRISATRTSVYPEGMVSSISLTVCP
jgi:hypothetical protein